MIVRENNGGKKCGNVEFISYTGEWPNLCNGVLTLKIDGVEYKFGHNYEQYCNSTFKDESPDNPNFERFWMSGGSCNYSNGCTSGEWEILEENLPEQFKKYIVEIDNVFNSNVPYGCCGGCL